MDSTLERINAEVLRSHVASNVDESVSALGAFITLIEPQKLTEKVWAPKFVIQKPSINAQKQGFLVDS